LGVNAPINKSLVSNGFQPLQQKMQVKKVNKSTVSVARLASCADTAVVPGVAFWHNPHALFNPEIPMSKSIEQAHV